MRQNAWKQVNLTHTGVSQDTSDMHTHLRLTKSAAICIWATGQIIGKQSLSQAFCKVNAIGGDAGCKRSWEQYVNLMLQRLFACLITWSTSNAAHWIHQGGQVACSV